MGDDPLAQIHLNDGATADAIERAERRLGASFPPEYVEFLLEGDGGEGPIGSASYLILWPVDQLAERNEEYKVDGAYAPDLLFIGTDGGNEVFAIRASDGCYVAAPVIGMSADAVEERGATFREFLESFP